MLRARKMLSALAAAAVLSTSAFAGVGATIYNAPVASAQAQIPATGNLQIHKLIGAESETPATGEEMTGVSGTPASEINFNVYRVNGADGEPLDLTNATDWTEAAGLSVEQFFSGDVKNETNIIDTNLGATQTEQTGTDGTATFTDLPAGVYLVVEQANQTFDGQALAPSEPFLVTVPMTNQDGTGWLDTVHVYPKNQVVAGATKTVGEDPDVSEEGVVNLTGSAVGELISYDVTSDIPATGANGLSALTMTDKLPAELGEPTNVTVSLDGGAPLPTTDYSVETWQVDGRWVLHVQLTDGLAAASAASTVTYSFDAPVTSTPQGTGLENQAWTSVTDPGLEPNEDPETENPGVSSNTARSIYGQINITKTGTGGVALPGAVFELHRCDASGAIVGDPIQVGGATTFETTDPEGTVSISGIHLANLTVTNGTTGDYEDLWATQGTQFCLEETVAPGDYSLLPAPVMVPLSYDTTTTGLVNVDQEISNVGMNAGFTLPLTGGNGFWLIVGAGVILLVVAGGYYVIARNRSESAN